MGDIPQYALDAIHEAKAANSTKLDLSRNKRRGWLTEIPDEVFELRQLTSLNLEGQTLTTIPAKIGQLKNLRSLNLKFNGLNEIPAVIGDLELLERLDLSENQLK